jgi:hypothetical protein
MAKFKLTLDPDSWVLDLGTMKISEAEQCESLTGWDVETWRDSLVDNRARAVKFAVYLARTRAGDAVSWKDLDFDLAALDWTLLDEDGNEVPPPDLGVTEEDAAEVPTGLPEDGTDAPA